jgi:hypothetical protein
LGIRTLKQTIKKIFVSLLNLKISPYYNGISHGISLYYNLCVPYIGLEIELYFDYSSNILTKREISGHLFEKNRFTLNFPVVIGIMDFWCPGSSVVNATDF